jgi:hypothetical protein
MVQNRRYGIGKNVPETATLEKLRNNRDNKSLIITP